MNYLSEVIKIALAEVGYLEKKTNSSLYSKTANAGYKNFTKYAADLDKISGFYNGPKNGYSWCSCFVDWCMVQAFGVDNAKKITYHTIYGAGCTWSARQYQEKGRFYKTPKVGDEIFFKDTDGGCSHTGLVYAVDTLYVYTVEGNTSSASGVVANGGAVAKKKYLKTYSKIYGYGRPNYDVEPEQTVIETSTAAKKEKVNKTVQEWQIAASRDGFKFPSGADGIWGNECEIVAKSNAAQLAIGSNHNDLIKFVQKHLGFKGKDVDGVFGNKTKLAVKKYQKKKKLVQDGIVGYQTYKAICGIK
jgi:hypothetical protein